MEQLFIRMVNQGISAGWLILVILLIRLLFPRFSRRKMMLLWLFVTVRLLIPAFPESTFSLIPSSQTISEQIMMESHPAIHSGIECLDYLINTKVMEQLLPMKGIRTTPLQVLVFFSTVFWLIGVVGQLIYVGYRRYRVSRTICSAHLTEGIIYEGNQIKVPFVVGILHPRVFLPTNLSTKRRKMAVTHEQTHIIRRDGLKKMTGYCLCIFFWVHPLVWIAYSEVCKDIEYLCDSQTIDRLGERYRVPYAHMLIDMAAKKQNGNASAVALISGSVQTRLIRLLEHRPHTVVKTISEVVLCVLAALFFLTDPLVGTFI